MTLKLSHVVVVASVLWLGALEGTGWCKNHVYKGTVVVTDLFTGETIKIPTYLVIGDAANVSPRGDYLFVGTRFVLLGPGFPKKRFVRQLGANFRALSRTVAVEGKTRTTVVLTSSEGLATDDATGGHTVSTTVLSGLVTNPLYTMPPKLVGTTLRSIGQSMGSADSSGFATAQKWKFALVRDLTDPIPSDETLAQSVDRVAAFLATKGFIEIAP